MTRQKNGIKNPNAMPKEIMKKLYDKRTPKVIILDVETAPIYATVEPTETVSNTVPYPMHVVGGEVNSDTVKEYVTKSNNTRYRYMTDKACQQIVFDVGWVVQDRAGNQFIHRSFVVEEIFLDMESMKHAHYFKKYPQYVVELASGQRSLRKWIEIMAILEQDVLEYGVREMAAYNANFDFEGALPNTHRMVTSTELTLFEDYSISKTCLWNWATQSILSTLDYAKVAVREGWVSEAGNLRTKAENTYRYIKEQYDFVEEHTGLEDAAIEGEIYAELWKVARKADRGLPKGIQPWKVVKDFLESKGVQIELPSPKGNDKETE